jgi:hypothetical protein
MRITLDLDEHLLEQAIRLTRVRGKAALIHRALEELIRRESSRGLTELGGTAPMLKPVLRRRAGRARDGWHKAFAAMAARSDDRLLDREGSTKWDRSEWKW